MSDNYKLDSFIDGIDELEYKLDRKMKEKILSAATNKITLEKVDEKKTQNAKTLPQRSKSLGGIEPLSPFCCSPSVNAISKRLSIYALRGIAACLTIVLIFAFIPNSPVNALCKKIFSFVPGIGITLSQGDETLIRAALNKPVKVESGDEFLEVRSAYVTNDYLYVSITTNIGVNHIDNIKDKKEVLKYFSTEKMPDIYLTIDSKKVPLQNRVAGGPSLETKAYNISGYFSIDEKTPADTIFTISMDGFEAAADITLSPVKNGVTPESIGNTMTVNDVIIFANTNRGDDIFTVELSSVAPKAIRGVRFYLFDHEKELFNDSVYVLDENGMKYQPDESLRKLSNSSINTFYFNIPDDKKLAKIVFPQVLYNIDNEAQVKIKMPEVDKAVSIDKVIELDDSSVRLRNASIVPQNDSLLPDEFKKHDCLKIDYSTLCTDGSNKKILRIIPDILVPSFAFSDYMTPSSSVYSELIQLDKNSGYALTEFDGMEKALKVVINFNVEFAIIGPFEMDISD